MTTVTLAKGAVDERRVELSSITVPDLWDVAMLFLGAQSAWEQQVKVQTEANADEIDTDITIKMSGVHCEQIKNMILDTWHLCHDLLTHISEQHPHAHEAPLLKNGASLILERLIKGDAAIVLAQTEREFVTWWKDTKGDTYLGHYFPLTQVGLQLAINDYMIRA